MLRNLLTVILAALLLQPASAIARGGHGGSHSTHSSNSSHSHSASTRSSAAHGTRSSGTHSTSHHSRSTGTRSTVHHSRSHGTKRDPAQRRAFQHSHPCPSTGHTSGACPGYVVDHVKALKHGGADRPSNMQWQTVAEAKAKDKD